MWMHSIISLVCTLHYLPYSTVRSAWVSRVRAHRRTDTHTHYFVLDLFYYISFFYSKSLSNMMFKRARTCIEHQLFLGRVIHAFSYCIFIVWILYYEGLGYSLTRYILFVCMKKKKKQRTRLGRRLWAYRAGWMVMRRSTVAYQIQILNSKQKPFVGHTQSFIL